MLNKSTLIVSMMLIGCGGSSFESGFNPSSGLETDGGFDATGGAATVDSDSGVGTGGKVEHAHGGDGSGGAQGSGGASTGGAPDSTGGALSATGGAGSGGTPDSTGGVTSTGGTGSGGAPEKDGGCALVTHDNGLGQTWQDCVPLGTYDQVQATKACKASGAPNCRLSGCSADVHSAVCGIDASGSFYYGGCWGYADVSTGHVVPAASAGGCPITTGSWR